MSTTTATTTMSPLSTPNTHHDGQPAGTASSAGWDQNFSRMGLGYSSGLTMMCSNRAVRFDSECVLIPELHKSKRPLMVTKSYSLPLWKKRAVSGESTTSNGEETSDHVSLSPPTTSPAAVVLKLPLPSFMAKPSSSRSRSRDCARPPCLVNSTIQDRRRSISPVRTLAMLPNAIPVVEHTHIALPPSSSSPTYLTFSEATSSATGTRSPISRSPSVPHASPIFLDAKASKEKEKEKDRHHHEVITIPLRQCCPDCFHITEESLRIGEHWEERFSRGARRRRGSSVSSATASESEGEVDPYSPMASYRPLTDLAKQEAANKLAEDNSNVLSGESSAVAEEYDVDDVLAGVTPLSLAVRVDEVDRIKGSRFTKHPSPSVEHVDEVETEDDSPSLPVMERETSSSSTGSAFSTTSSCSGSTSATSEASACEQSTSRRILSSMTTPASVPAGASRPRRTRKPSTPINEEQEPPEEKYVGYCQDRARGRAGRDKHRLKTLKVKLVEDDDDDMLFPLPSPRRSPTISPLNTPKGSLTPTPGSKTPSPNPSPSASSSTVHLNAPKRRSRLRLDTESESSHESSSSALPQAVDEGAEADLDEKEPVFPTKSIGRNRVESMKEKELPPSIAKAAEIALAETQAESLTPQEELSPDGEWVNVRLRSKISGHSKVASEPTRGSVKEDKQLSLRIPSFSHHPKPSTPPPLNTSSPHMSPQLSRSPPSPSEPMPKPKRKTSLRSSAGAFFDIFKGVSGITP